MWKQQRKLAGNKYRELSNEEKDIKGESGRNRYRNIPEKDKTKTISKNFRYTKKIKMSKKL